MSRRSTPAARDQGGVGRRTTPPGASGRRGGPARWRARSLFARNPMTVEEPPRRADADRRTALSERLQLDQRDFALRLDRTQDEGCLGIDPGRMAVATLRFGSRRAALNNQLTPADCACALTPKRAVAARHDIPASTTATTRSRRSCDSTRGIHAASPSRHKAWVRKPRPCESSTIQMARKPL